MYAAGKPGYRQLLRTPGAWSFVLPGFAARQPFAMLTIGIVLLIQHTSGSYGIAGAVSATAGVSMAVFAPQGGKLADRFGQAAVLVPGVLTHAASVTLLTVLALGGAPLWALFVAAVPAGASVPQVGPMVRARWAALLGDGGAGASSGGRASLQTTAAAFESVTDEFTFVIGPVLTTALCTGAHPAAGLLAEASLTLVGGLLFAAQRRTQPAPSRPRTPARTARWGARRASAGAGGAEAGGTGTVGAGGAGAPGPRREESGAHRPATSALGVPGVRVLAVVFLGIGSVFGGLQVSLTAFTEEIGQPGINGVLYGVFAAGNMVAGIVCGALSWRRSPQQRLLIAYPLLTLATSALWAVHAVPLLGALGLLVGLCIAPALITGYTLVDALVPATARTEAFTWLTGAVALGQAGAATAAGQLADGFGPSAGFVVPLAGTGLALTTLVLLRGRLATPSTGPVVSGSTRGVGHREAVTVD
ncbi:MFS transporter [Streptomyces sp. 71268]|uniref:MFS transporter n=1 Tax=Streptomyces sp. 71268 TaxID=3002640 RepID=UPI0023F79336|nr:MFS transporter [Streptomyces sp. 71268]WEV29740.1 MFS transporter [Streptomyces sp. 71268]